VWSRYNKVPSTCKVLGRGWGHHVIRIDERSLKNKMNKREEM
jgi:hypothetical protein